MSGVSGQDDYFIQVSQINITLSGHFQGASMCTFDKLIKLYRYVFGLLIRTVVQLHFGVIFL